MPLSAIKPVMRTILCSFPAWLGAAEWSHDQRLFRAIVEQGEEGICVVQDELVKFANNAMCRLTGRANQELLEMPFLELLELEPYCIGEMQHEEAVLLREDGQRIAIELRFRPILHRGRPAQLVSLLDIAERRRLEDALQSAQEELESQVQERTQAMICANEALQQEIVERKRAEECLNHLAYHDLLTGLPNRLLFHDRLNQALALARRQKTLVALMLFDLDRFKEINDTLGHDIGDRLLQGVAKRLLAVIRENDTVARLGGDEFFLVFQGVQERAMVELLGERILGCFHRPFLIDGQEIHVTPSIGISLYPDDGADPDTLSKNADLAMYRVKAGGRNNYHFFEPSMSSVTGEKRQLEVELRKAIEQQQFLVYYQPQIDVLSERILGSEALIRWQHPEMGMVSPLRFVPLAEETGLIDPITEWMLFTACEQNRRWQAAGLPPSRVAINLSAQHFGQGQRWNLVRHIVAVLERTGLDPRCLELEITESLMMQNLENAAAILGELNALGIRIAIDDFGTGYSSLNYLRRFPIQTLKIDRCFISGVEDNSDSAAIVKAVIAMAHNLDIKVVAEGVETLGQRDFLRLQGCDEIQGYLFGKPAPPEVFADLLRHQGDANWWQRKVLASPPGESLASEKAVQ